MTSETPNTSMRVALSAIVAVTSVTILLGLIPGTAEAGDSAKNAELENFVKDVNRVCSGEQGFVRDYMEIEDYRVNRSQNNDGKVMLVDAREEVQKSMIVDCSISNEFSITNNYVIEENGRNSVTVSEQSLSDQIGDSDE